MIKQVSVFFAVLMCACGLAYGTVVIETWDSGIAGWAAGQSPLAGDPAGSSLSWQNAVAGKSGVLQIEGENLIVGAEDKIYGALEGFGPVAISVSFDFYTQHALGGGLPGNLHFYFVGTNSTVWTYELGPELTGNSWNSLTVELSWSWNGYGTAGWEKNGLGIGSHAELRGALSEVSEIGILLMYQGGVGNQVYGLENFAYSYPEPGTYAALGFALMSLSIVFRGKLSDSLTNLRNRLKG